MSIPAVVGFRLDEARALLGSKGIAILDVKETRPPRRAPEGPLRVVRQRALPEGVELTVAASVPLRELENGHGAS